MAVPWPRVRSVWEAEEGQEDQEQDQQRAEEQEEEQEAGEEEEEEDLEDLEELEEEEEEEEEEAVLGGVGSAPWLSCPGAAVYGGFLAPGRRGGSPGRRVCVGRVGGARSWGCVERL